MHGNSLLEDPGVPRVPTSGDCSLLLALLFALPIELFPLASSVHSYIASFPGFNFIILHSFLSSVFFSEWTSVSVFSSQGNAKSLVIDLYRIPVDLDSEVPPSGYRQIYQCVASRLSGELLE
jgi:hypothetical protein